MEIRLSMILKCINSKDTTNAKQISPKNYWMAEYVIHVGKY